MSGASEGRSGAVVAIAAVLGAGQTLEAALARAGGGLSGPDRAQAMALAFGALRFGHRLKHVAMALLPKPWDRQSPELQALLLVGLYQLEYGATPPHAAVSTTVEAARAVGEGRAAGLVNACLRRFQRERLALLARADATLAGRSSHPEWYAAALARDWPDAAAAVLEADNAHPPLTLRANARRIGTAALADRLEAQGHAVRQVPFAPRALVLEQPLDVRELEEFRAGLCSVQDAAAQLAAPLLGAAPGMRVLDACAAPGGKTGHLLEEEPGVGALVALDVDPARTRRIRENLDRLGLAARIVVGDALDPSVLAGERFDRILLDAPCSGTGVIRRHPDIKWLRRPADVAPLAHRQRALLEALWARLAPGGRLLYATCSVLKAENAAVVAGFLAATPEAVEVTESASLAVAGLPPGPAAGQPGLALLPGITGTDGFYYACIERRAC
jgi:16S rRNA (cytosine967-C5)-methyltransferase